MNLFRKFVWSSAITAAVIGSAFFAAFNFQFGAPIEASYDVANWRVLKENLAASSEGPRVLLVGDSNILFGMDSAYMQNNIGLPVINFGMHGGLPFDWILEMASRNTRSGDVVVLPLVWNYYINDYKAPEDWMIDQVVAWNHEYFEGLSFFRKLQYAKSISIPNLRRNIEAKIGRETVLKTNPLRVIMTPDEAIEKYNKTSATNQDFLYSYINMNLQGDMKNTCGTPAPISGSNYSLSAELNGNALELLTDFVAAQREKGVRVFIAAPVQVDDGATRSEKYQFMLNSLWRRLGDQGFDMLGTPTDFFFPANAFFNTPYHLNCGSDRERSVRLSALLKPALQDDRSGVSTADTNR